MAHPIQRTFSFENNDEVSLGGGHNQDDSFNSPYRDHPSQNINMHRSSSSAHPTGSSRVHTNNKNNHLPPSLHQIQTDLPPVPPHRQHAARYSSHSYEDPGNPFAERQEHDQGARGLDYSTSMRTTSTTTPGMDNMGVTAAGGGIAGIAYGVASSNERHSGLEALRAIQHMSDTGSDTPPERNYHTQGTDTPYIPEPPYDVRGLHENGSYSSTAPLGTAAAPLARVTTAPYPAAHGMQMDELHFEPYREQYEPSPSPPNPYYEPQPAQPSVYTDNPYQRYSSAWDPRVGHGDFNPDDIADDGDDGITGPPITKRKSALALGRLDSNPPRGAVAGGTVAGGILGGLGSGVTRKPVGGDRGTSGNYGPVPAMGSDGASVEKSPWLTQQTSGRRKLRWIVGTIIAILVVGAVVGGIIGGILGSRNNKNSSSGISGGETASQDEGRGDLDKNSAEIKALLNNKGLHRVFPGMAYTPFNAQYPACLLNPPSQNNVTRDMAMLSQLTNTVRLYGTDCNQTEMVLHAIDKLGLTDMKVWMAVWLDNNVTTNARGMKTMYDILDKNGAKPFAGVIFGNEVLFREQMTPVELNNLMLGVKSNFTQKSIKLPIAIADLGDKWNANLTPNIDVVMSNIHPFFAGVTAADAAGWTWDFWQHHDVVLTTGTTKKNVISEVGWPSDGGNCCGAVNCTSSTQGSIAGIDELNQFLGSFVCQSLANGTDYFWFESFDEPWKAPFNEDGKNWEDKWGLMDSNRILKSGVKIPDCGGRTI